MTKVDALKRQIIASLQNLQAQLEQLIRDKRLWNLHRHDDIPFDIGFELTMLQCVNGELDAWDRADNAAVNAWSRKIVELGISMKNRAA